MDEKYQRIKVLGKGSFGKAYLVKNTEANELCVVKQMETSTMDPKERNEAVREAMLLKRMDHKNIVRFQEVFMTRKGRLCIVMDYADGGDVHMEIKRRNGALLEERRILEWFVQICFAMKHVHDRKVLHRDLKTQNIFLMATGQIKLGDFGIARVLDATKDYAKTMVGTPYYLSPEIIEDKPYNFKSDVWSCGVVLYEMTTLKHPFDAESLVILASKILKDQVPPPDPSYSANLAGLLKQMLSKDAKIRPDITNILGFPFLQESMHEANQKFSLGQDLSEFTVVAAAASASGGGASNNDIVAQQIPGLAGQPQTSATPQLAAAVLASSSEALVPEDTVLMGTVQNRAAPPAAPAPASAPSGAGRESGDEEDYDEDFEDLSGSEDGGENKPSELKKSVANLKLGGTSAAPSNQLAPVAESSSAGLEATGGKISQKADSLRTYLQSQLAEADFSKAYALVRASAQLSPEDLQRRVADVIGAEKAPELFTLFQLLCFLEDVSTQGASS